MPTFKSECEKWINLLGLTDFEVYYDHSDESGQYASCRADMPGMSAVLQLNASSDTKPTHAAVRRHARHEVLELLLQPLWHALLARELHFDWAQSERHAAIRRLENLLGRIELFVD